MESQELNLPLMMDTGDGVTFSPINTVVVTKGMDNDGDICYAVALSEGTDVVSALALLNYGLIDIENRVKTLVAPDQS